MTSILHRTRSCVMLILLLFFGISTSGQTQFANDPDELIEVRGNIVDSITGEPVEAYLEFWKKPDGDNIGIFELEERGVFDMMFKQQASYMIDVVAPGYFPYQTELSLYPENIESEVVERDFRLRALKVGEVLRLKDLNFEANRYDIMPAAYPTLGELIRLMELNPSLKIRLEGHTNIQGTDNIKLSKQRVRAIEKYLVGRGIEKKRIAHRGYGGKQPLVTQGSAEQRAVNRRVEVRVTSI
ncbi:MAG: OmpA family protein [Catalinimonas sp.]